MKRSLLRLGVVAAMLFTASVAFADEVQLSWTSCVDDGGLADITFACNTNAGNRSFITAIKLTSDMNAVLSNEITIDLISADGPALPDWWSLRSFPQQNYVACRPIGATQAIIIAAHDGAGCPDIWAGSGSMNFAGFIPNYVIPGSGRILAVNAVPSTSPVELIVAENPAGNGTWAVGRFQLNNQKTVGTPNCAGCQVPVCIVLNSVLVTTLNHVADREFSGGANDQIVWQGGSGADCQSVPARNVTWGKVKSLYR